MAAIDDHIKPVTVELLGKSDSDGTKLWDLVHWSIDDTKGVVVKIERNIITISYKRWDRFRGAIVRIGRWMWSCILSGWNENDPS